MMPVPDTGSFDGSFESQYNYNRAEPVRFGHGNVHRNGTAASSGLSLPYKIGDSVVVEAPATSANMGCGFDCFGVALKLFLRLEVRVCKDFSCVVHGTEADESIPLDSTNSIVLAFMVGLRHLHALPPAGLNFSFDCSNHIPVGRGLGSSAAAIVAGLGAAFALCGRSLDDPGVRDDLAVLACRREGHPDNVMPAIFGEMQIGVAKTAQDIKLSVEPSLGDYIIQHLPFPSDDIKCIVFVPAEKLSTAEARKMLPNMVTREAASQNVARAGMLVAAFALRDYRNLRYAVEDSLHQPHRLDQCPSFTEIKKALPATEALAVYLSGAGPSSVILAAACMAQDIASDFQRLCNGVIKGRFLVLDVSKKGVEATVVAR